MSPSPADSILPGAAQDRRHRAGLAARTVQEMFGARALRLPGTWLGAPAFPQPGPAAIASGPWHYWWQAHLLDALVDASRREAAAGGDPEPARRRAHQLLRGITVRSGGTVILNDYYDDMAWLMLAVGRLRRLDEACRAQEKDVLRAGQLLLGQLRSARTEELGGGMFWNRRRRYKNAATTGPGCLVAVRTQNEEAAASLLEWMRTELWDAQRGVFWDGLTMPAQGQDGPQLETGVYTYNSGPVLGAALELAESHAASSDAQRAEPWAQWAAQIVLGADAEFARVVDSPTGGLPGARAETPVRRRVLRTHGPGDGGLFTGVLTRYLAQAADSPVLPDEVRATARRLVLDTADALWDGRREYDPGLDVQDHHAKPDPGRIRAIFSADPALSADATQRVGASLELSAQIQAWTILEAAARMEATIG